MVGPGRRTGCLVACLLRLLSAVCGKFTAGSEGQSSVVFSSEEDGLEASSCGGSRVEPPSSGGSLVASLASRVSSDLSLLGSVCGASKVATGSGAGWYTSIGAVVASFGDVAVASIGAAVVGG